MHRSICECANRQRATLISRNHGFKNISEEKEIFELFIEDRRTFYVDPVCRMLILDPKIAVPHPGEDDQYFCSADCLEIYLGKYKDAREKQNQ